MKIGFCSQLHLGNGGLNKFTGLLTVGLYKICNVLLGIANLHKGNNMCDFPILLGLGNPLLWKFSQKTVVPSTQVGIQSTTVLYDDGQII